MNEIPCYSINWWLIWQNLVGTMLVKSYSIWNLFKKLRLSKKRTSLFLTIFHLYSFSLSDSFWRKRYSIITCYTRGIFLDSPLIPCLRLTNDWGYLSNAAEPSWWFIQFNHSEITVILPLFFLIWGDAHYFRIYAKILYIPLYYSVLNFGNLITLWS